MPTRYAFILPALAVAFDGNGAEEAAAAKPFSAAAAAAAGSSAAAFETADTSAPPPPFIVLGVEVTAAADAFGVEVTIVVAECCCPPPMLGSNLAVLICGWPLAPFECILLAGETEVIFASRRRLGCVAAAIVASAENILSTNLESFEWKIGRKSIVIH